LDTSLKACEDYDYWLRAAVKGYIPLYCGDGIVYYRRHQSSMSANLANQWYHDAVMHHRLYRYLFEECSLRPSNPFVSRLAFLAGLVFTIYRLSRVEEYADTNNKLIELLGRASACMEFPELEKIKKWDITTRMYCHILVEVLSRKDFPLGAHEYPPIIQEITNMTGLAFHMSSLLTLLTTSGMRGTEKRVMRKHLVKRIRNAFHY
jgi:hypothetical protein